MPTASPFLDELLTRWNAQRKDIREEALRELDALLAQRHSLDDARRTLHQTRTADVRTIEETDRAAELRWAERLYRLEQWKTTIRELREERARLDDLARALAWFEKAQSKAGRLLAHLERRLPALVSEQAVLHDALLAWSPSLEAPRQELAAFHERQKQRALPLLVSRARKKPYSDFVRVRNRDLVALNERLTALRRNANRFLNGLYRASKSIETRAAAHPAIFEIPRQSLQEQLKEVQRAFFELRQKVLSDILLLESLRQEFKRLVELVDGMKCLEEVYWRPTSSWKRFWRRLLPEEGGREAASH